MKKVLLRLLITLIVAAVALYLFREPLREMLYAKVTDDMFVPADTDSFDPGPAVGSSFPGVHALYQGKEIALLSPLAGENGTVLVASRSLDWCPFCL